MKITSLYDFSFTSHNEHFIKNHCFVNCLLLFAVFPYNSWKEIFKIGTHTCFHKIYHNTEDKCADIFKNYYLKEELK